MSKHYSSPEFESPIFTEVFMEFRDRLAEHYTLPHLAETDPTVTVSSVPPDTLERVTERTYSVTDTGEGGYSLNNEDYASFSAEIDHAFQERTDTDVISRRLFVGLGVAGAALSEILQNYLPAPLKRRTHAQMLREFFASHDAIEEGMMEIFTDKMRDRAEMVTGMYDARAMSINGLRMRLRILYDALGDDRQLIPVSYDELTIRARQHIPSVYENESKQYCDVAVFGLAQSPKVGDQMFFATLPDWLIAAAVPMRPKEYRHFFSPAWQKN